MEFVLPFSSFIQLDYGSVVIVVLSTNIWLQEMQVCPHIHWFSTRVFSYLQFNTAPKKFWKLKK
jgi:hypothetical protein